MACCGSRPPPLPAGASALRVDGAPGAPKRETSFKVVVMGDKGIGKSAVVCRFTRGSFADGMATTIGAAFAMKDVPIDDGVARLQIWGASSSGRRARGGGGGALSTRELRACSLFAAPLLTPAPTCMPPGVLPSAPARPFSVAQTLPARSCTAP